MIEGIDHIGIAVESIESARGFYEALGLEVETIEEVPQEGVRVAIIPCGASRIELLEPTRDDSPIARFLDRRGPGMHHLCLSTGVIFEADEKLRAGGFRVLRDEPTPGAEGRRVQFIHPGSASGVLVELSQRPSRKDSRQDSEES
ncbi:MAG: methylmalonyl-CoA epimerase [Acidobacteriota bacterium]|nr:methylmalonyl-CoA epimerase [Acidobacteriota bacterium]